MKEADYIAAMMKSFVARIINESERSNQYVADLTDLSKNEVAQLRARQKDFRISTLGKLCAALEREPMEAYTGSLQRTLNFEEMYMLRFFCTLTVGARTFFFEYAERFLRLTHRVVKE